MTAGQTTQRSRRDLAGLRRRYHAARSRWGWNREGFAQANAAISRPGSLIAYGPDFADLLRRVGTYVDRILRGAAADLPVEQPTKFELVINLKTAKAWGCRFLPR